MNAISVIVPVYNVSLYLRQCIDSILSQSFSDFELILVNDGSTDNSLEICKEYAAKDKRVCVIDGPNGGVSVARNKGLDRATGEWIAFADADDYFLDDALLTLYNRAQQTCADLVLANVIKLRECKMDVMFRLSDEVTENVALSLNHFALWGYLFKSSTIQKHRLRFIEGLAYSEDIIIIYQVILNCKSVAFCSKSIYVHRINKFSACSSTNGLKKACHLIDAAYFLQQLAKINFGHTPKVFLRMESQCNDILRLCANQCILLRVNKKEFVEIKERYKYRFGNKPKIKLKFNIYLLIGMILFIKSKIKKLIKI